MRHRVHASWMYMAKLAAAKEFAYMKALKEPLKAFGKASLLLSDRRFICSPSENRLGKRPKAWKLLKKILKPVLKDMNML